MTVFARNRRCAHGATIAPTKPPPPTNPRISPMVAVDAPRSFASTMTTRTSAWNMKLLPAIKKAQARKNDWRQSHRTPSAISRCRGSFGAVRSSWRSARTKSSVTIETAYETASATNGTARSIANKSPPIGWPASAAPRVRASFWAIAVGICSWVPRGAGRTARRAGRTRSVGPQADDDRVRRRPSTRARLDPGSRSDEPAGGQLEDQVRDRPREPDEPRLGRLAGDGEDEQRERDRRDPAAEDRDRLPRPEQHEVPVVDEARAGGLRRHGAP